LATDGIIAGGSKRNRADALAFSDLGAVDTTSATIVTDAQTSGGLLIAVDPSKADIVVDAIPGSAVIGSFVAEHQGRVVVN
jgi:selenide,water dikinase